MNLALLAVLVLLLPSCSILLRAWCFQCAGRETETDTVVAKAQGQKPHLEKQVPKTKSKSLNDVLKIHPGDVLKYHFKTGKKANPQMCKIFLRFLF